MNATRASGMGMVAGLLALAAGGGIAMGNIISDGVFADSNWTMLSQAYGVGGGSGSGAQVLTGGVGDNGAARRTSNQAGGGNSGSYNASIYTAFTYSPAVSGALTGLSIGFDSRYIDGLSSIGAAVEQDGLVWFWGYEINTPNWQRWTFNTTNVDWYRITSSGPVYGSGPDFSASGGVMRFGYFTGNGSTIFGYTHSGLSDNFTVNFVPGPSVAAALGLGGLFASRRRAGR